MLLSCAEPVLFSDAARRRGAQLALRPLAGLLCLARRTVRRCGAPWRNRHCSAAPLRDDSWWTKCSPSRGRTRCTPTAGLCSGSSCWERRDRGPGSSRGRRMRTSAASEVPSPAHAEATIDRIGVKRDSSRPQALAISSLLRELARCGMDRAFVFRGGPQGGDEAPLRRGGRPTGIVAGEMAARRTTLLDARLLTSYEIHDDERGPSDESKSSTSPCSPTASPGALADPGRRWRRAARRAATGCGTGGEHDPRRSLWSGTAYREFLLWHERYPGGLTEIERAFRGRYDLPRRATSAQASNSGERRVRCPPRRPRGRRHTPAAKRPRALRAEAATLPSQAQVELESYPSAAVAYATGVVANWRTVQRRGSSHSRCSGKRPDSVPLSTTIRRGKSA